MLADYFDRSAVAAAQVLEGFDPERFKAHLEQISVGVSAKTVTREGEALLELGVRLLARLYPRVAIAVPEPMRARLAALAVAVNPNIEVVDDAEVGIIVGDGAPFRESLFTGCDGWDASINAAAPLTTGDSSNPLGAGAAACLAAAGLFRRVFLPDSKQQIDRDVRFSLYAGEVVATAAPTPELPATLGEEAVLVGAGAIGHGALWALRRLPIEGTVHVIDMEAIELSNLQRYVLAERADEGAVKVKLAARASERLRIVPHHLELTRFLEQRGYRWPQMLLALDSARDRVAAQASLPGWVANAWTQPGDLGVSSHSRFGGDGACVACLYLPATASRNEDDLVAEALGVPHLRMQIRTLLYTGAPVDRQLLDAVAQAIGRPLEALLPFEGRSLRELYVEGFCGGAVIPLGQAGRPHAEAQDVHVPLAHQSALAGILLAAALVRHAIEGPPTVTATTRIDVLHRMPEHATQPTRAARDGRCICDDGDYVETWESKYAAADG